MIGLAISVRNAKLNAVRAAIDAAGKPGRLCIYAGKRPSTGGVPTELLAELALSMPCAPDAKGGELGFGAIAKTKGVRTGRASWARLLDGEGGFVLDLSAGGPKSGADVELDSEKGEISEGVEVGCPSFVLVEPGD